MAFMNFHQLLCYIFSRFVLEEDPSLLVIVVDANRVWWGERAEQQQHNADHNHSQQNGYAANGGDTSQPTQSQVCLT